MRLALAIGFLLAQLASIAYARFVPTRYFAWTPYDAITFYDIQVRIGDRRLEEKEVQRRYRLFGFRDNRSPQHVIDIVRQYETTYGAEDGAQVILRYRTNGRPERTWLWPER